MGEFAEAVKCIGGLQNLDISANKIDAKGLQTFLEIIHKKNQLRYLNLSFNSCSNPGKFIIIPGKTEFDEPEEKIIVHEFFEVLVDFVHC